MSRSHRGQVKLDIKKLERHEQKIIKRLGKLDLELVQTRKLKETLEKALVQKAVIAQGV